MGDGKDDKKKHRSEKPSETVRRLMEENSRLKKQLAIAQNAKLSEEELKASVQKKFRVAGLSVIALGRMGGELTPDSRDMIDNIPIDAAPPMVSLKSKTLPTYLRDN